MSARTDYYHSPGVTDPQALRRDANYAARGGREVVLHLHPATDSCIGVMHERYVPEVVIHKDVWTEDSKP